MLTVHSGESAIEEENQFDQSLQSFESESETEDSIYSDDTIC